MNLLGTLHDDLLFGSQGRDIINGDAGDDIVFGHAGPDRLFGGDGVDVLVGGRGADHLEGGLHGDILRGGRGDDTFRFDISPSTVFTGGYAPDVVTDFNPKHDKLKIVGATNVSYNVGAGEVSGDLDSGGGLVTHLVIVKLQHGLDLHL